MSLSILPPARRVRGERERWEEKLGEREWEGELKGRREDKRTRGQKVMLGGRELIYCGC